MENQEDFLHSNVDLTYEYTKERIKDINDGINRKITGLAGILTLCGATLRFTSDLPGEGYFFTARLIICILLLIAIVSCIAGLRPMDPGRVLGPKNLLEPDLYRASDEQFKTTIIYKWIEYIPKLKKVSKDRGDCLFMAFTFLGFATIAICITIAMPQP